MNKILIIIAILISVPSISHGAFFSGLGYETGSIFDEAGVTGTGSMSVVSSTTKNGDYSFRSSPTGTAVGWYIHNTFGVASTTAGNSRGNTGAGLLDGLNPYISFYFRHDLLPVTGQEPILQILNTSFVLKAYLTLNDDGKISLRDTTNVGIATSTTALSAGTWYRIDLFVGTGAAASYELRINESTEASGTANFTTGTTRRLSIGKMSDFNGNSMNMYYDDIVIGNSEFPGSGYKFLRCDVDSDGTYTQFTGGTGSSNYLELDETPGDASTYVQSTANNDIHTVGYESASACGVSGTIIGVMATQLLAVPSIDTIAAQSILISGTTQATTTSRTDILTTFGRSQGFWFSVDPATMSAWTTSGIDGIQFGAIEAPPSISRLRITAPHIQVGFIPEAEPPQTEKNTVVRFINSIIKFTGGRFVIK